MGSPGQLRIGSWIYTTRGRALQEEVMTAKIEYVNLLCLELGGGGLVWLTEHRGQQRSTEGISRKAGSIPWCPEIDPRKT